MGFIMFLLNRLSLVGILFAIIPILCCGERNSLDNVPTSQFDLQEVFNECGSNKDTWLQECNPTKNLCNQSILYPKVKTFLVNDSICLTNVSQNNSSHWGRSRPRVEHRENFTDCIVSTIPCCPNTSNSTCHCPSLFGEGKQLVFAVLNCTRSLEKHDYCLILAPSSDYENSKSLCSKRILPVISATSTPTTTSSTTIKTSEDTVKSKIHGFIKDNLFLFIATLGGFILLVVIVAVICCCCCCRRKKSRSSEAGSEQLPHLAGASGFKGSAESVLYIEPNAPTDPRYRITPDSKVTHNYDYAYAHQVPSGYGDNSDRPYVNARKLIGSDDNAECFPGKESGTDGKRCSPHKTSGPKADCRYVNLEYEMKSEYDGECPSTNDGGESSRYSSLMRSTIENDNEYQPLSSPTHPSR